MSVVDRARARGVTRLVHLTPTRNIPHILDAGAIRPVATLHNDVRACFVAGDLRRLDGRPEFTCCSVEYPNLHYLRHAALRQPRVFPDWTILMLDLTLLDRASVLFVARNAASRAPARSGGDGYEAMYADTVTGAGGRVFARGRTRLPAAPTDEQAEVLVPGDIGVSHIRGVIAPSTDAVLELRAQLSQVGRAAPASWVWMASSDMFAATRVTAHLRAGRRPQEDVVADSH